MGAFSCYPSHSLYLNDIKYECSLQATSFFAQQLYSFSLQQHGHNLLTQTKVISNPLTTHLPRHQIIPQNLTLPPELINTIKEMFINKDTLPIFHPVTYKPKTLGIIAIRFIIVLVISLNTGFKLYCCPHTDILKLCCNWRKTHEITTPKQQEIKTMERS